MIKGSFFSIQVTCVWILPPGSTGERTESSWLIYYRRSFISTFNNSITLLWWPQSIILFFTVYCVTAFSTQKSKKNELHKYHKSTNTQKHKYNGLMSAATCRASPNPDPDIWCEMQLKQGVQIQPNWTLNRGSTPPKCENYFCFTFISVTGLRSFLRLLVENSLWLFNQSWQKNPFGSFIFCFIKHEHHSRQIPPKCWIIWEVYKASQRPLWSNYRIIRHRRRGLCNVLTPTHTMLKIENFARGTADPM